MLEEGALCNISEDQSCRTLRRWKCQRCSGFQIKLGPMEKASRLSLIK